MKRVFFISLFVLLFAAPTIATERGTMGLGLDFALPYIITADENNVTERGNFNIGVDGRYFLTENWNTGARFNFDLETRSNSTRQVVFAPGVQYHWMPGETWNPFFRFDLPVYLRDQQDIGINAGLGLVWNLGQAMGMENLLVRGDIGATYTMGLGDALRVFAFEFFKIGFDYRF